LARPLGEAISVELASIMNARYVLGRAPNEVSSDGIQKSHSTYN
jgi:hypothetical protein